MLEALINVATVFLFKFALMSAFVVHKTIGGLATFWSMNIYYSTATAGR